MPLYRCEVTITGVVRVEADNIIIGERMVRIAEPLLAGKQIMGSKVIVKIVGEVKNQVLSPGNVAQSQSSETK